MSKCRNCNVEILDETEFCPLCHSVLEQTEELENMYPDARLKTQKLKFFTRLYLFCAIGNFLHEIIVFAMQDIAHTLSFYHNIMNKSMNFLNFFDMSCRKNFFMIQYTYI